MTFLGLKNQILNFLNFLSSRALLSYKPLSYKTTCISSRLGRSVALADFQVVVVYLKILGKHPCGRIQFFIAPDFILVRSKSKVEEDIAFILKNFKRSHISCQITAGGGTILDSVKNLQDVSKKKLVLIAPICQKTLKVVYLYLFPLIILL